MTRHRSAPARPRASESARQIFQSPTAAKEKPIKDSQLCGIYAI
jgi:hypothetical protein